MNRNRGRSRDVVVIGASAGGVEALRCVAETLPGDLDAAVFVVLHLSPTAASVLPRILARAGRLPAVHPENGARAVPGMIVVAPPDRHLGVADDGRIALTHGPRLRGYRPAVDRLFTTAASFYGPRVVGVILTGALDDGSAGLAAIARAGGAAIVQDPADALYPAMPANALRTVPEAEIVALDRIGPRIAELVRGDDAAAERREHHGRRGGREAARLPT